MSIASSMNKPKLMGKRGKIIKFTRSKWEILMTFKKLINQKAVLSKLS